MIYFMRKEYILNNGGSSSKILIITKGFWLKKMKTDVLIKTQRKDILDVWSYLKLVLVWEETMGPQGGEVSLSGDTVTKLLETAISEVFIWHKAVIHPPSWMCYCEFCAF